MILFNFQFLIHLSFLKLYNYTLHNLLLIVIVNIYFYQYCKLITDWHNTISCISTIRALMNISTFNDVILIPFNSYLLFFLLSRTKKNPSESEDRFPLKETCSTFMAYSYLWISCFIQPHSHYKNPLKNLCNFYIQF